MAYAFNDAVNDALADLVLSNTGSVGPEVGARYCREVYHELLHSKPDLASTFDETSGEVATQPEVLPDDAQSFPDFLDTRKVAILALLRAKFTKLYLTSDAQVKRFGIDSDEFNQEQGLTKPR